MLGWGAERRDEELILWLGVGIREGSQRGSCSKQPLKEYKSCAAGEKKKQSYSR